MSCESELPRVWVALCGLSFCVAAGVAAGYQVCIYRQEAAELQPYLIEPMSAVDLFWNDLPLPRR
jgi:hypothetical protein